MLHEAFTNYSGFCKTKPIFSTNNSLAPSEPVDSRGRQAELKHFRRNQRYRGRDGMSGVSDGSERPKSDSKDRFRRTLEGRTEKLP